jgi:hypothetical protein
MKKKPWRNFLWGLFFGAGPVYWYAFHGQDTVTFVLDWLQAESEQYQAEHPPPKVDVGWHKNKKK